MDFLSLLISLVIHWHAQQQGQVVMGPPPPPARTHPFFVGDPNPMCAIVNMHGGRVDGVQMFRRSGGWEILHTMMTNYYAAQLKDRLSPLQQRFKTEQSEGVEAYFRTQLDSVKAEYYTKPAHDTTNADIATLRHWLHEDGNFLAVSNAPLANFAYDDEYGNVHIAKSSLTKTGWPDMSVVFHECTHHIQANLPGLTFTSSWDYEVFEPNELAAMVVENCYRISEGWTVRDMVEAGDDIPLLRYPEWSDRIEPVRMTPLMATSLAYSYMVKYGPDFSGDTDCSLLILRMWVPRFEKLGTVDLKRLDQKQDWMAVVRKEEAAGTIDPLASTCQMWLAINGQPSMYGGFVRRAVPKVTPIVPALTQTEVKALPAWRAMSKDRQATAAAFLARCGDEP